MLNVDPFPIACYVALNVMGQVLISHFLPNSHWPQQEFHVRNDSRIYPVISWEGQCSDKSGWSCLFHSCQATWLNVVMESHHDNRKLARLPWCTTLLLTVSPCPCFMGWLKFRPPEWDISYWKCEQLQSEENACLSHQCLLTIYI